MGYADRMIGELLNIQWRSNGGTVFLQGDYRSAEYMREQETVDASAGGDGARAAKKTLRKFSASVEICYTGTAGTAVAAQLALGQAGTLILSPLGTATGNPRGGGPMIVTKASFPVKYDDLIVVKYEFEGAGAEIYNPHTDVW